VPTGGNVGQKVGHGLFRRQESSPHVCCQPFGIDPGTGGIVVGVAPDTGGTGQERVGVIVVVGHSFIADVAGG
jgi:hypothetical protein